jgi:hypothetical protein
MEWIGEIVEQRFQHIKKHRLQTKTGDCNWLSGYLVLKEDYVTWSGFNTVVTASFYFILSVEHTEEFCSSLSFQALQM